MAAKDREVVTVEVYATDPGQWVFTMRFVFWDEKRPLIAYVARVIPARRWRLVDARGMVIHEESGNG